MNTMHGLDLFLGVVAAGGAVLLFALGVLLLHMGFWILETMPIGLKELVFFIGTGSACFFLGGVCVLFSVVFELPVESWIVVGCVIPILCFLAKVHWWLFWESAHGPAHDFFDEYFDKVMRRTESSGS